MVIQCLGVTIVKYYKTLLIRVSRAEIKSITEKYLRLHRNMLSLIVKVQSSLSA